MATFKRNENRVLPQPASFHGAGSMEGGPGRPAPCLADPRALPAHSKKDIVGEALLIVQKVDLASIAKFIAILILPS